MQATLATNKEKYLGVVLTQGRQQAKQTGDMLVQKFQQKLVGLKVNLLSHAGKMVLIKSVLTSVPVYYMSIEKLSNKIVNQLEGNMRRFMWGKTGKEKIHSHGNVAQAVYVAGRRGFGNKKYSKVQ